MTCPDCAPRWFLAGVLGTTVSSAAVAGSFQVAPIPVDLHARATSALVVVTNQGDDELRIQVSAVTWTEDGVGEPVYAPTADLVVFPTLLAVPPGEERKVRVGYAGAPPGAERAYRVFVEEMPTPRASESTGVSLLTRFGVPVFVAPPRVEVAGSVMDARAAGGRLALRVVNGGTVRFKIEAVEAVGRDASGAETLRLSQPGWYVFAGQSRSYAFDLPAGACPRTFAIEIAARSDRGTWTGAVALPCAP